MLLSNCTPLLAILTDVDSGDVSYCEVRYATVDGWYGVLEEGFDEIIEYPGTMIDYVDQRTKEGLA